MQSSTRLRRSPRLHKSSRDYDFSHANDEIITRVKDDRGYRTVKQGRNEAIQTSMRLRRSPRLNKVNRGDSSFSNYNDESVLSYQDGNGYDLASLASTENDDGTADLSDDCSMDPSTSVETRRYTQSQNEKEMEDDIGHSCETHEEHCEVGKYMVAREMTPLQERMNALTFVPGFVYCVMFFLTGSWLSQSFIEDYANRMVDDDGFDTSQCITSSWFPNVHAMPPLASLAAGIGIIGHTPFSMLYHWQYAHRLPSGLPRMNHWSRRMDQAMIHFCCAMMSFASTGNSKYFLANTLFNMDCFYRQFLQEIVPKRNQRRIGIGIFFYSLPLLLRGDFLSYFQLLCLFALSGWLFAKYPIGGWSHAVFHIVLDLIPPIMFASALKLSSSQSQLEVAAHCAILADKNLGS